MLKKFIIIENGEEVQFDKLEELVKELIDEEYYNLTPEQKKQKMEIKAIANCMNNKMEIVENATENIEGKFIIKDEFTYILSLLITNNVILLERKDSNIFSRNLRKEELEGNYIIVNKFAKKILSQYIRINN